MQGPTASLRVAGGIGVLLRIVCLLTLLLLTAGCARSADGGGSAAAGSSADGATTGAPRADDDLVVRVDQGDGSEPVTWTLTCGGTAGGTHPAAQEACAHLGAMTDPFAAIPADVACTEQYGGPQSAHIVGRWGGQPVDLEITRVDGCRISQWDGLVPLLPAV